MNRSFIITCACFLAAGCFLAGCLSMTAVHDPVVSRETPSVGIEDPATPRLTVKMNYTYHAISGVTADDLRRNLNIGGYRDQKGRVWDAYTRWRVIWSYPYEQTEDGCRPGPVKVDVRINYYLPRWEPPPGVPQSLLDHWDQYKKALLVHEKGHKDLAVAAGFAILNGLEALFPYPSCEALENAARALGGGMIQVYQEQERMYDRLTGYGKTQGVRFP